MLEFKKSHGIEGTITSSFAINSDGSTMIVTRLIDGKGYRLVFELNCSVGALGARVNQVCDMDNTDFKTYSEIQFSSMEESCGH